MKIMHPLNLPLEFKQNTRKTKPKFQPRDFEKAISSLRTELSKIKLKHVVLSTDYPIDRHGKVMKNYMHKISGNPRNIAQLEFELNGKKYTWIVDTFFRTADNIYSLSIALKNWSAFKNQKLFIQTNEIE